MNTRVGIGYDSHRYAAGRPLRLAGVTVPHTHGLVGHSDGDAALHALIDALLGAAALGDIGQHFPDDDPQWRGADSSRLLRRVVEKLQEAGFAVGQADITVVADRPKIGHLIGAMRAATAKALGVDQSRVSIKAKTNEGMGWLGRGEGVAAVAVATVESAATG
ncbi:MAG TPA: 2-C-methyl-D-erythritol 2,4-cyclodiphosphate synthase [Gemmatimonadales bacterium]|nr:2-C-methyl-D-erythritol 2,4-cyclodiphosphate synthase [Gemmatimonadales bacterium]